MNRMVGILMKITKDTLMMKWHPFLLGTPLPSSLPSFEGRMGGRGGGAEPVLGEEEGAEPGAEGEEGGCLHPCRKLNKFKLLTPI